MRYNLYYRVRRFRYADKFAIRKRDLEERVKRTAHLLHISKTEVIKKSIQKFLSEINMEGKVSFYDFYMQLEGEVPGSGHGSLSADHRKEVLQRMKDRA